jgi:virginiamycin B lyase
MHGRMRPLVLVLVAALPVFQPALVSQTPASSSSRPADEIPLSRLKAEAILTVALAPGAVATAEGLVLPTDAGLARVVAGDNSLASPMLTSQRPCGSLASGFGALWVPLCQHGRIARVDGKTSGVGVPIEVAVADPAGRIAVGVGSVWVASTAAGIVSRVDADTGEVVAEIRVAGEPSSVAFADDAVWVTSARGDVLTHINAHTNEIVDTLKVGPRPGRLVVGEGAVWTLNRGDGSISRVDPKTHKVEATIAIGADASDGEIAAGAGSVWVSAPGLPLVRIDPRSNRAVQRFTGAGGGAVIVAHGSVWVAADAGTTWRLDPVLLASMRP